LYRHILNNTSANSVLETESNSAFPEFLLQPLGDQAIPFMNLTILSHSSGDALTTFSRAQHWLSIKHDPLSDTLLEIFAKINVVVTNLLQTSDLTNTQTMFPLIKSKHLSLSLAYQAPMHLFKAQYSFGKHPKPSTSHLLSKLKSTTGHLLTAPTLPLILYLNRASPLLFSLLLSDLIL
jgi:hypothetical protein